MAHPGYRVLSDILFRLGLVANAVCEQLSFKKDNNHLAYVSIQNYEELLPSTHYNIHDHPEVKNSCYKNAALSAVN